MSEPKPYLNIIDTQGREFLSNRGLCWKTADKLAISSEKGEIIFPYFFEGNLVRVKYRSMTDKKKMRFNILNESEKADFKMPFWNQRAWPTSDRLFITEGELDTVALTQLGENKVVSLPNGSGSVAMTLKNQYAFLQNFELIYIAFDMDAAGEAAVEEAKKIIPHHKFRRIKFPAKDANDWIAENPTVTQADFEELILKASKIHYDELVPLRDLPTTFFLPRFKGFSTGWKTFDQLIGGIRPKELTTITADTGAGKTTFCINLMCNLINGTSDGFWVNSWEMDHEVVVRKIASVILGSRFKSEEFNPLQQTEFIKWMKNHNAIINPKQTKADIGTLRKQVDYASRILGVKYVLLDHLDYIVCTSPENSDEKKLQHTVRCIHEIAMEFNVHIFLIAHAKQTASKDGSMGMEDIKGGAAPKQYSDNVWVLQNMAQANLNVPDNRVKVFIHKNRFIGNRGVVTLRYNQDSDSYSENSQIFTEK